MAVPRMYPDEPRGRAARLAIETCKDPAGRAGTDAPIAEHLLRRPRAPAVGPQSAR
ncbi:hypothetical protein [Actinacidiphila sp. ITFR-21]|uniref:hypothetical protein n=1 Tax=Actinacidiphila sp. ITFR-21 TaxID=3075199 RepID=UPI00288B3883|nr:hypothetical protein [Streptomyces sp. ITFR-21]WNI18036.1 hypothetical protein RLT57_22450 [Streptomyces sp. ITFR-21]